MKRKHAHFRTAASYDVQDLRNFVITEGISERDIYGVNTINFPTDYGTLLFILSYSSFE